MDGSYKVALVSPASCRLGKENITGFQFLNCPELLEVKLIFLHVVNNHKNLLNDSLSFFL